MTQSGEAAIHQGLPVLTRGRPLEKADRAVILVHGRGASPESILALAEAFSRPEFAYLAPAARGNTWYPHRFIAPLEHNEPYLSSALSVLDQLVADLDARGIPPDRLLLGGFSQGACLVAEFVARRPRRYGGVFVLSGGVMGPENAPRELEGSLEGTPVFLGCGDPDEHIPLAKVKESTRLFKAMGGCVTERIYPGLGHAVNRDEIEQIVRMMDAVKPQSPRPAHP